jgi:muconolactone delta-isomerase
LVDFDEAVPPGVPASEVDDRRRAEALAAAKLTEQGHILRIWNRPNRVGNGTVLGLYRADSESELEALLASLPLRDWMDVTVSVLEPHPNDPAWQQIPSPSQGQPGRLPAPRLTLVYGLEATLGDALDLGQTASGRRRIVAQTGGTFTGPKLSGKLLPGASADWQVIQPDGTALVDIRYTLQTDSGALLYVQSRGTRHGDAEVLARLGRGEDVAPSEYVFRTATQIETAASDLDWLNKGVFVSVGARKPAGVTYETYLVG